MKSIPVRFGSLLGTIGAVVALLVPMVAELADAVEPLGVPATVWVVVSAVMAGLVVVGRMGQAIAQYLAGSSEG